MKTTSYGYWPMNQRSLALDMCRRAQLGAINRLYVVRGRAHEPRRYKSRVGLHHLRIRHAPGEIHYARVSAAPHLRNCAIACALLRQCVVCARP
jgi:hypothetical protein